MRFWLLLLLMAGLIASASCSHEAKAGVELAVEQSVDRFHEQLNQQQYHQIYLDSDPELRSRIGETEFTNQLVNAHEQLGAVTSKARVMLPGDFWPKFKRAILGGREQIKHGAIAEGGEILASELFVWEVENDQARLVSYEFVSICRKPCRMGFGYP